MKLSAGGTLSKFVTQAEIRTVRTVPAQESVVEADLRHGDLLSMEGMMQKHTMHFVTREPRQ